MAGETLFVSDLHLAEDRPDITERFVRFVENRAHGVDALYILGDLFDVWVGDDDTTPPNNTVSSTLKTLAAGGTAIFFQHGNRDFLLSKRFAEESGVELLDEHAVVDLYGTRTLVMHGDLLCTDDMDYLKFRAMTRSPLWQRAALAKPLEERMLMARQFKAESHRAKAQKSMAIMDVNREAVIETMTKFRVSRLIHGHTHRPAVHELSVCGHAARRFVLAEWDRSGSVLCWNARGHWVEDVL